MSTTLEPRPAPPKSVDIDIHSFEHHWQDEADAAYLYRILAAAESDPKKKDIYSRLADVEDRHVVVWGDLLTQHGHPPSGFRPSGRARLLAKLGAWFGPGFLLPMLLEEEGREVKAYLDMHRQTPRGAPGGAEALVLARESADHATTLGEIAGKGAEPWHKTESGGFLRNVVYGFNDGLTANFGLVAGVIGAATVNQHQAVVVAGMAGLIADALSMGSSGYLASKSEREVYEYEISMEKTEVDLMPEIERDELAVIYEAKGMDRESAHSLATQIMADPQLMLKEQVQEELKIGEFSMSPLKEGWLTGLATAFGAAIPVFPFLVWHGATAIIISFGLAMLSHFLVGAARSVFTGRGVFRSGFDMFVVGIGVAVVGYFVGGWVGRRI
ncbi:MAG TPA: VIT1/CCC1 transporter family protein [Gemmatimonadaceae bacterium]|jgi:predicted membrane protein (TIGR00267 family)|nr:VIT1/CCC1 transporter family protein [Gemmatimonadaceae bacterium]